MDDKRRKTDYSYKFNMKKQIFNSPDPSKR